MKFYLEDMIAAIDLKHESNRISAMKFDAAPLVRAGQAGLGGSSGAQTFRLR